MIDGYSALIALVRENLDEICLATAKEMEAAGKPWGLLLEQKDLASAKLAGELIRGCNGDAHEARRRVQILLKERAKRHN